MGHATDLVDQLVGRSDLIVWVLDPQKYADAAVHRRFLVPLAGHSEVVAVVLNQADLLSAGQIEDCVQDLRRLLDSEDLPDVQILVTSAKTGAGIEDMRKLLIETVTARKAADRADLGRCRQDRGQVRALRGSGSRRVSVQDSDPRPGRGRPAGLRAQGSSRRTSPARRASPPSAMHCAARASFGQWITSAGR